MAGGDPALYTTEIFLLMITPPHIAEWRGLVSYEGGLSTFTPPVNLKNQLEFLLHEKFDDICLQDWAGIRMEVDHILS